MASVPTDTGGEAWGMVAAGVAEVPLDPFACAAGTAGAVVC